MGIENQDLSATSALVIDGSPNSKALLVNQLNEFGVGTVRQASRLSDARELLENMVFDFVLCEMYFQNEATTGQELLDDLRRNNLLPYSTVFIMVTGEATYTKVAEAAESALDGYLLKPHKASQLEERLFQSRLRKITLADIFQAIEEEKFSHAAELCQQRYDSRDLFWLTAARVGAELMLRIGEYDKANALYAAIVEAKTLPWAKLGVARALVGSGQLTHAVDALSALISEDPSNGDAYDVMGRAQLELGNMGEALQTYQMACNLTPNSITRMQNLANIMFSVGRLADAEKLLGRAALIGKDSKMFDPQSLVTLAFTRLAGNDRKGLQNCVDDFQRLMGKRPKSDKLTGQASVIQALLDIHTGQNAKALDQLKSLGALAKQRDFGFDMACNCLALAAQLAKRKADVSFGEELSNTISLRFVTNRPRMELLAGAALQHPPLSAKVREISAQVFQISRDAIKLAMQGEPATATVRLLSAGRATLNSKLIETAGLLLKRYASKIANGSELESEFKALTLNFGENSNGRAGSDQPREAGGLKLRIGNSEDV